MRASPEARERLRTIVAMNSHGEQAADAGGAPDINSMLAASFADDSAPLPGMLARSMVYNQDAERKLERARAMKQEAAKYRDEVQRRTVEQTEAFCAEARAKADEEYDAARKMRAEAEGAYDDARAELERAATVRAEADAYAEGVRSEAGAYAGSVRAEADAYRRSAEATAAANTAALTERAQLEAAAALAEQKERMEDEVRRALRAVEKVQSAVQEELEAQQMYTEAFRFRTASPTWTEPAPVRAHSTPKGSRTAKRRAA